jgi:hypothetical protein
MDDIRSNAEDLYSAVSTLYPVSEMYLKHFKSSHFARLEADKLYGAFQALKTMDKLVWRTIRWYRVR